MAKISLKPIVSLIDIMDKQPRKTQSFYHIEQTEPLDLCLNNNLLILKSMDDNFLKIKHSDSEDDKSDVVFVKEYKLEECVSKGRKWKRNLVEPRRNPKRQVRKIEENRNEFVYDSGDDEKLNTPIRNQDISEEWSCENPLKMRQKRNNKPPIKKTNKRNRKNIRDINRKKVEKKAIADLEPLITSNLDLIKSFLNNFHANMDKNIPQDILRNQLILLSVTTDAQETDLLKHLGL